MHYFEEFSKEEGSDFYERHMATFNAETTERAAVRGRRRYHDAGGYVYCVLSEFLTKSFDIHLKHRQYDSMFRQLRYHQPYHHHRPIDPDNVPDAENFS